MKTLAYWSNRLWKVSLSEEGGKFQRHLLLGKSISHKSGWANKSRGKWFAVYRKNSELLFRCDEWSCRIDKTLRCTLDADIPGRRVFKLTSESGAVFRHEYSASNWQRKFDATYDGIDAENDDFFLWLSGLWSDESRVDSMVSILAA